MKNPDRKRSPLRIILRIVLIVLLVLVLVVGGYFAYLMLSYSRIEDNLTLDVPAPTGEPLSTGTAYTAVTNNIGFGAYTPDYTFFMDGGKESWGRSAESVKDCINQAATTCLGLKPDFLLLQEVDTDSTRSYHIDQAAMLKELLPGYVSTFAQNYHSAFLMYPFTQPHGASNSGIMTFSKVSPTSAVRYSLPVSETISKLLDLDRCFMVDRYPVDNGKELVVVNVHASAYGNDASIREQQLTKLFGLMKDEYDKGNYVICGGDFNHDFTGVSVPSLNEGRNSGDLTWAQPLPMELLPSHLYRVSNYKDNTLIPTCRNNDVPYGPDCMTLIVDGFIVSENVETVEVENISTGFAYSDHQPVRFVFRLK